MTGPFADRLFRITFALAGVYNLAFGLWAGFWPLAFFELFDLAPPRYPGIWACLGMVVGVYGLLYLHAAWRLQSAWPIIAVGFLGKVLGPIGMLMSFGDDWPLRLGMICVYNDLIWWLPFGLFLLRGTTMGHALVRWAPWLSVSFHAMALVALVIVLRHGGAIETDTLTRGRFIAEHATAWAIGWTSWMLAAISLVGFYAWWGSRLTAEQASPRKATARRMMATCAVLIAGLGMVCDFSGEALLSTRLVELAVPTIKNQSAAAWDSAPFTDVERAFTLLSAGAANGLYTLGGMILTLITADLPRWVRAAVWGTWLAAAALTVASLLNHVGGMVASTVVLFPLLLVWTAWMGACWRRP